MITKQKVKVKGLSKFGFFAEGMEKGVYFSKNLPESDKTRIVPGLEFEAELYTGEKGGVYLNKVLSVMPSASQVLTSEVLKTGDVPKTLPDVERAKKFTPKFTKVDDSEKMSKADWNAKDRSQLIGGLSHDAAAVAVAVLNLDGSNEPGTESALRVYKTLLQGMLKIREELK